MLSREVIVAVIKDLREGCAVLPCYTDLWWLAKPVFDNMAKPKPRLNMEISIVTVAKDDQPPISIVVT